MKKISKISETPLKDWLYSNKQVNLSLFGIFDSEAILWKYYVLSVIKNPSSSSEQTTPCIQKKGCNLADAYISEFSVPLRGIEFKNIKEATDFINDFKTKWETKSNDSKSVVREEKLKDILTT
mgnify:CR=1 FL=1